MIAYRIPNAVTWTSLFGLIALLCVTGCGFFHDPNGPGSYQAATKAAKSSEEVIEAKGGKLEQKQYPLGSAWAIDLSGTEIDEGLFKALSKLGHIAELNFSGSTLTDDLMSQLAVPEIGGVLVKLDLSKTEVTDEGLAEVTESLYLSQLNVSGSKITPDGVEKWQKDRSADDKINSRFKTVQIIK